MARHRRAFKEPMEIADIDRLDDDLDDDMLFPDEMPHVPEEDLESLDKEQEGRVKPAPTSDMQGVHVPDSIAGSSDQMMVSAGEEIFKAEYRNKHRKHHSED